MFAIERPGYGTKAMLRLVLYIALTVASLGLLLLSLTTGGGDWLGASIYATFSVICATVAVLELQDALPHRLEIDDGAARLFVRGSLRREIAFDSAVEADADITAGATPFKVDPFAGSCCSPGAEAAPLPFQTFEALRLSRDGATIECSVEQGWRPEDLARVWPHFLRAVLAHGMARGKGLQGFLRAQEEPALGLPRAPEGYGREFWEVSTDELLER